MTTKEHLLNVYRTMALIREFEDRLHENNLTGEIPGFMHLSAGHEAISVGICEHLEERDHLSLHHRAHGHCIARGADVNAMMAELYGKDAGICRGKGGSMHVADIDKGIIGANGIIGMSGPLGLGAALTHKSLRTNGVALTFAGDGASNHGFTFEAMNLAVVLNLPCVFIYENNGFSEFTGHDYAVGSKDIAARAAGFGMPAVKADGTDYYAVSETAKAAIDSARNGNGPNVLELSTGRRRGHFEGDAMPYRSKKEIEEVHTDMDPLIIFRGKTSDKLAASDFDKIHADVKAQIDAAVDFARGAPTPPPENVYSDVYVSY